VPLAEYFRFLPRDAKHSEPASVALLVASRYALLATVIGESGFEAQAG